MAISSSMRLPIRACRSSRKSGRARQLTGAASGIPVTGMVLGAETASRWPRRSAGISRMLSARLSCGCSGVRSDDHSKIDADDVIALVAGAFAAIRRAGAEATPRRAARLTSVPFDGLHAARSGSAATHGEDDRLSEHIDAPGPVRMPTGPPQRGGPRMTFPNFSLASASLLTGISKPSGRGVALSRPA